MDFGDGPGGRYEVVGTGANVTTSHTYATPVAGTKITVRDYGGNRFLMGYFSIYAQFLSGTHPNFVDFDAITTVFTRDNYLTGEADFAGCDSIQYIFLRNVDITSLKNVSNKPDLVQIYADASTTITGDIPSMTGCPDLALASIFSQAFTGFEGGFTPAVDRTTSFRLRATSNSLPSSAVDSILIDAQTAEFGTGDRFDLDGTGNAPPTQAGLDAKTWLEGNGCLVYVNS